MKNFKKNIDGITLIALVITIIVLLILAGISIAMLTGENGILGRAGQASETTKDVSEDEQVKLAVADALINGTGTLSTENIEKALKSEFGEEKVTNDTFKGDGPWTFKGERNTYTINSNGTIELDNGGENFKQEEFTVGEIDEEIVDYYGHEVKGYDAGGLTWWLFYQDDKYTYITSDVNLDVNAEFEKVKDKYKSLEDLSVVGKIMYEQTSDSKANLEQVWSEVDLNSLEFKYMQWLSDPKEWKTYCKDKALFCMGAPNECMWHLAARCYGKNTFVNLYQNESDEYCLGLSKENDMCPVLDYARYVSDGEGSTTVGWLREISFHTVAYDDSYRGWGCARVSLVDEVNFNTIKPVVCFRKTDFWDYYGIETD